MNGRERLNRLLAPHGYLVLKEHPYALHAQARWSPDMRFLIEHEIFREGEKFNFVQVGANDGVSRKDDLIDYVRHYGVSGVLVEPQQDVFERLRENFREFPSIRLVNKAIHASEPFFTLYKLDAAVMAGKSDLPNWARSNGVASFSRDHVLAHARKAGLDESAIVTERVTCVTLTELFRENGLDHVTLLKVDTEGYDYPILKTLDLEQMKPRLIRFEHLHMPREQLNDLLATFVGHGYRILHDHNDTIAYLG
jgi:FkbM family methyltransferase